MPIKLPRFSRRKSVGNSLEGGYVPANTGNPIRPGFEDDELHHPGEAYGGYGTHNRYNTSNHNSNYSGSSNSGGYYGSGSSNRLSSSSTLPSSDPRTPASTDDHSGLHRTEKGGSGIGARKSRRDSDALSQSSTTLTSGTKRSVGGTYSSGQVRKMEVASSEPPKLETHLDSTSFEDMLAGFGAITAGSGIGKKLPAAPKLATSNLIPPVGTGTPDTGTSIVNTPTSKLSPSPKSSYSPLPPQKSYSPVHLKQPNGLVAERINTWNAKLTTQSTQNMYSEGDSPNRERWHGRPSEEALVSPSSIEPDKSSTLQSRSLTHSQSERPTHARQDSLNAPPKSSRTHREHVKQSSGDSSGLKRTSAVRRSIPVEDADAILVMNNLNEQQHKTTGSRNLMDRVKDRDSGWEETIGSGNSSANSFKDSSSSSSRDTGRTSISNSTPAASRKNTEDSLASIRILGAKELPPKPRHVGELEHYNGTELETSALAAATLTSKYESEPSRILEQPVQQKKVMTKAQFERYRQQQDEERKLSGKVDYDSSDSESDVDGDSDTERKREIAKQREKQEAHLSVYRQQMMKITGSTSSGAPPVESTTMLPFNNSMPQLSLSGPASSGGKSDDEDEEVPLAILMAHGFPGKNRPPTRLSNSSSHPNLRGLSQQQSSSDLKLPPFARNLPADPYNYGASLLNPVNRATLGLGGGSDSRSVAGGSVYGGHPGGLIGEIALAEEMKAARRGTPLGYRPLSSAGLRGMYGNGGGTLGLGGGMPSMGTGMIGMPQQPMMPVQQIMPNQGLGTDPMQMQMANQMQQMMQMQMQWMQMQQQMMQGSQQMNTTMIDMQRPSSMAVPQVPAASTVGMPIQQRTVSMVDPTVQQLAQRPGYAQSIAPSHRGPMMMGLQPGYAPSMAPSERSTIGLPSRYRPVCTVPVVPPIDASRTSTMTSTAGAAWGLKSGKAGSGLKNTSKGRDSDDDDDSAWEELKKKRLEKKDGWRKKKESAVESVLTSSS